MEVTKKTFRKGEKKIQTLLREKVKKYQYQNRRIIRGQGEKSTEKDS